MITSGMLPGDLRTVTDDHDRSLVLVEVVLSPRRPRSRCVDVLIDVDGFGGHEVRIGIECASVAETVWPAESGPR